MIYRRLIRISVFVAFMFLQPLGLVFASSKLTFYTVNFPPYLLKNPDEDGLRGFDVEVVIEAFRRVGTEADVQFLPWKRVISLSKEGRIAGAVSCVRQTEREAFFWFSEPISFSTQTFVYTNRYNGRTLKKVIDAKGLKVLVVAGYSAETELKEAAVSYETAVSDQAAIIRLLERPYDVFYTVREFMEYTARKQGFSDRISFFDISRNPYHLCISKGWPDSEKVRKDFNEGLAEIIADGTYKKIHDKYR